MSSPPPPEPHRHSHGSFNDLSPEPKRQLTRAEKFVIRHGSKLHGYDRDKVPYPMSYNREDLELGLMDFQLISRTKRVHTFVNYEDGDHPRRCLDIGTGLGNWVIDAAKAWPDCTFVGYDLMNVQIPHLALPEDIADRVEWVHGNILRTRLPFDDEEFDHVHISSMAFAVPENKWISFYEEIRRVLRTGGKVEQIEEDATFPILPRWFTEPLHARVGGPYKHLPEGSQSIEAAPLHHEGAHEHELLESLFRDVFEKRFINPLPTSCLPGYFTTCFGHVLIPPVFALPMPPLAPLEPLPAEQAGPELPRSLAQAGESFFLPPVSDGASSWNLSVPSASTSTFHSSDTNSSTDVSSVHSSSAGSHNDCVLERPQSLSSSTSSIDPGSPRSTQHSIPIPPRTPIPSGDLSVDSTRVGEDSVHVFAMEEFLSLDEHSLNMQLFRALGLVMSAKEAMWDELVERITCGDPSLRQYGWENDDYTEAASRVKFDALIDQYKKDIRVRVSLWHSMVLNGWEYPRRDPISRAEMMAEHQLRRDIFEARKQAKEEDLKGYSRTIRLMVGTKVSIDQMS